MSDRTALLLVDCQNDFLDRAGLTPPRDALLRSIAAALDDARAQGMPIFHVRTSAGPEGGNAMPHRRGNAEVIDGTHGAASPDLVAAQEGEPIFEKRFFSAFNAPGLVEALADAGITDLRLAGVHTHACIQATALDAYARGLKVQIDPTLIGSDRPALAKQALEWIDGRAAEVVSSTGSPEFVHRKPTDPSVTLFTIRECDATFIDEAVVRLRQKQPIFRALPLEERRTRLQQLHARISRERVHFVEALIRDVGKPRRDAQGEVDYGLALLETVAMALDDREPHPDRLVRYRPIGIAGIITPWNNPFAIPLGKLAPALGYGNGVLWKPAPAGSGMAAMLHDSLRSVGLGALVERIDGDAETGRQLTSADGIDALSFTGSVPVGRSVILQAGRRAIPVQAELGGSNAAIVDASADISAAAGDLVSAIFSFAGQRCTAIRQIVVIDEIYDVFAAQLKNAVGNLRVIDPADPACDMGPMINAAARQRVAGQVEDAIANGAILVTGGTDEVPGCDGPCWLRPTILANLPAHHSLLTDEAFGPVATLLRVATFEDAIAVHNATEFGLVGVLYSSDDNRQKEFLEKAEAGMLSVNRARPAFSSAGPFSGWKASGHGAAEHGRWNRDFYTRPQVAY